jgi:hypothetical protein
MSRHGVGPQRGQGTWTDLLSHLPRNTRDRGLHFRTHPLGCVDPLSAGLTATCVRRHAAQRVHRCMALCRNALAVAPPAALAIDPVVGLADGTEALRDLLARRAEALVCAARRGRFLCEWLQAGGGLWGATRPPFFSGVARALKWLLSWRQPLLRRGGRLCRRPRRGGHGAGDRFDQLRLHMADVRRVVRPTVLDNIRQQARRCIAGRLDALTVPSRKRLCHAGRPGVLSAAWGLWLQADGVALGFSGSQAKPPAKRFILGPREGLSGPVFGHTRAFLVTIRPAGLLHGPVALRRRPLGSRDNAIEACEWQE